MSNSKDNANFGDLWPDESRKFIEDNSEGTFTLLDVRQVIEYEEDRIPGAKLIPLPELHDRITEISKEQPILVYCASGGRSRAASQLLVGSGFEKVYNMIGGMHAWEGRSAAGPPDMAMSMIRGDESATEIIQTAYLMENALGEFYRFCAGKTENRDVAEVFHLLAKIEDKHKNHLMEIYRNQTDKSAEFLADPSSQVLEGGINSDEFLERIEGYMDTQMQVVEMAMMMETQALDLYLRFSDKVAGKKVKQILFVLADEEKGHLKRLGDLMDQLLTDSYQV